MNTARRRYFYQLYGVIIETEDPFPDLTPVPPPRRDIPSQRIFVARQEKLSLWRAKNGWSSFYGLDYWFSSDRRFAVIQSSKIGVYRIDFKRKRIRWSPAQKASSTYCHAMLRVRILGFLVSHMTPSLLLHASVVVRKGVGIALGGFTTAGKSTLTACCLNDGFSLLSDDIAAIQKENGSFFLHPGSPEFRLWPWTARRLNPQGAQGEYITPEVKKKKFILGPASPWRFTDNPVPLRAIYLLSRKGRGDEVRIENLHGKEAVLGVLENIYNPIFKNSKLLAHQLEMAAPLIRKVSVKRLVYPSGFVHLPRVRSAIVKDIAYTG